MDSRWLKLRRENFSLFGRPVLPYLELHLASHCNLRCRGCSHFSPLSDIVYAEHSEYERDLRRLKDLFKNIRKIRLLGGEPLLNSNIEEFLKTTRMLFRHADIRIATNGVALKSMKDSFWESCLINGVRINWTVYPPYYSGSEETLQIVRKKGIDINSSRHGKFRYTLNLRGNSDPEKAFRYCRSINFVPFLRNGRIYTCSRPALVRVFNEKFDTRIPEDGYIDIHNEAITGWDILLKIAGNSETCRFCPTHEIMFDWSQTDFNPEEWDVSDKK